MGPIGFSTGALAKGDFRRGLQLLANRGVRAVELSALREHELPTLMASIAELDVGLYDYISVHAPSRIQTMSEATVAEALRPCIEKRWPVILHPDAIVDYACWKDFGPLLCLENMDKRKSTGRTADELRAHFDALPEASLCLDLGHARQVDPTLGIARLILKSYGRCLTQVHLSELNALCRHEPLSMASVWAFREIAHELPPCPVILESVVLPQHIDSELAMAGECFDTTDGSGAAALDATGTG